MVRAFDMITKYYSFLAPPQHHPQVLHTTMTEGGMKLKAAILVVSDTASKDASTDKCIPALKDVFSSVGDNQWEVTDTVIVPDDVLSIQKAISGWTDCSEYANLIITSGGTGFATKDVTPEVRGIWPKQLTTLIRGRQSHLC
jgi:molybdopterin biosynthesis enzyme MoaB